MINTKQHLTDATDMTPAYLGALSPGEARRHVVVRVDVQAGGTDGWRSCRPLELQKLAGSPHLGLERGVSQGAAVGGQTTGGHPADVLLLLGSQTGPRGSSDSQRTYCSSWGHRRDRGGRQVASGRTAPPGVTDGTEGIVR